MDSKDCWLKRDLNVGTEWELGSAYQFLGITLPGGANSFACIVTAKADGMTMMLPGNQVYLTDENPDSIQEKIAKAKADKAEKERAVAFAESEKRTKAAQAEAAKLEAQRLELEHKAQPVPVTQTAGHPATAAK